MSKPVCERVKGEILPRKILFSVLSNFYHLPWIMFFVSMPLNTIKDFSTFVCGADYRQVYSTL